MVNKQEVWSEVSSLLQAYAPFYREDMLKHVQKHNAPDNWFTMGAVRGLEPEPLRLAQAQEMMPYTAISRHQERYEALVVDGCLGGTAEEGYHLTKRGRTIIEGFFTIAHSNLADIKPLPEEELQELLDLLARLAQEAVQVIEPAEKLSLDTSRWTDPGPESSLSARIDQYVTDLYRFRDDAHMGTWKPLGVEGYVWEAFSDVWRDENNTAEELAEQLAFRGYSSDDYAGALRELTKQGWVEEHDGRFRVTEKGKQLRDDAEKRTDRLFFGPWSTLSEAELDRLQELSTRAKEKLQKAAMEQFWLLASGVSRAIFSVTRSVVNEPLQEHFSNPRTFGPLLMAIGNQPEPVTVEMYRQRFPYVSTATATQLFEDAVDAGHLKETGARGFALTDQGLSAVTELNDIFYSYLDGINALPDEDMAGLAELLDQVVEASLAAGEPTDKRSIVNMNRCHSRNDYGPLAKIDQHLDDLNAFRDDSHLAAWQHLGVEARSWEALTLVWREDAASAAELVEQLSEYRGYDEESYALSLDELTERGWISKSDDGFKITEEGRRVREEAEEATNRIYYAPWASLDSGEQFRLRDLLIRLRLNLEELAEVEE